MSWRTEPPFRADHVGSLLRPPALLEARAERAAGRIDAAALRAVEDQAIREAVALQERVGIGAVTDGEFRRTYWHFDFLTGFDNVELVQPQTDPHFRSAAGQIAVAPPSLHVYGKLGRSKPIFVDHFAFLKSIAAAPPKQTIPSPSMMHGRGRRGIIEPAAYADVGEFYEDLARVYRQEIAGLAAVGCRYLQLDEVNLAFLCDPKLRQQVERDTGEDADKLLRSYAGLINGAIADRPAGMTIAMHLCRGNFQSGWGAEGGYDPVAEMLFNEIAVDAYFLEYDDARSGGFEPLRFLPKGKIAVLGLVTTKTGVLEDKDALKRRIDEAARFAPLEQLALSPQCGFSSTVDGNRITLDDEIAKLSLVVEVAREIWG